MQQAWDQAIGAAPVSTVDVDQVVAQGRRHGLRRRLAAAAGGTALATVGVITAVTLTTAGTPGPTPPTYPAQPAAATAAAPVRDGETQGQRIQRLATALTDGLSAALPGVLLADGPTGQPGVTIAIDNAGPPNLARYSTDTVITATTGRSEVFFEAWSAGSPPVSATPDGRPSGQPAVSASPDGGPLGQPAPPIEQMWVESCAGINTGDNTIYDGHRRTTECATSTGPDGQTIVALTEHCLDCTTPSVYAYSVYVTWTNARVGLSVSRDLKRGGTDESLAAPVLSLEQLIAIAVDPELTVTS